MSGRAGGRRSKRQRRREQRGARRRLDQAPVLVVDAAPARERLSLRGLWSWRGHAVPQAAVLVGAWMFLSAANAVTGTSGVLGPGGLLRGVMFALMAHVALRLLGVQRPWLWTGAGLVVAAVILMDALTVSVFSALTDLGFASTLLLLGGAGLLIGRFIRGALRARKTHVLVEDDPARWDGLRVLAVGLGISIASASLISFAGVALGLAVLVLGVVWYWRRARWVVAE